MKSMLPCGFFDKSVRGTKEGAPLFRFSDRNILGEEEFAARGAAGDHARAHPILNVLESRE
jgi:hypothetical protein